MLALSPLRTSDADDQRGDSAGGFSDPFVEDEADFLDIIDFSGIFEGFGTLDSIDLQVSCVDIEFSAGVEEQATKGPDQDVMTEKRPVSGRGRKPETKSRFHGKKKVTKVDWTPELHRRFEQAVEQLGVDKAVPSRILELMGINNLTRHNVASHLQKYRSHRKHLLAREAEAASWSHRRQVSSVITKKEKNSSWLSPTSTLGFPPPAPFLPLHVWGHPTVDHRPPVVPVMWQGNATLHSPAHHHWPPQPPNYVTYWQPHNYQQRFAGSVPVTGVPPHQMYRAPLHWVPLYKKHPAGLQPDQLMSDYPSKESIDAAFGDVLAKPWLPLPLGLKPPSTESVLVELQRQGVSKVPPSACNSEGN